MTISVIFDVFGVMLTRGFDSSANELSKFLDRDIEIIRPVYERWEVPFDLGSLSEAAFWKNVQRDLDTDVPWHELNSIVLESYLPIEGTFELVQECAKLVDVYTLSNTRKEWFEYLDVKFEISKKLKRNFLSYELHMIKPSHELFRYVAVEIGADPSNIVYFDDNVNNIKVAKSQGFAAVLFADAASSKRELIERKVFDHG